MRSDAPTALDLPIGETMADKKLEEFSAIGKQTMARAYSAMDYYFDHLKKTVASAPSGGTEFREKVKACAEQNISATQEFVRELSYAKDIQDILRIQMEFMRSQMETFGEQARDLGDAFVKAASGPAKPSHSG
jgi:hypothetical protein